MSSLDQAVSYALDAVDAVTPELLTRPTPCRRWDLHMLLSHTGESLAAFQEGVVGGRLSLYPAQQIEPVADPAGILRSRLTTLRDSWPAVAGRPIVVADRQLPDAVLADVAALEIAVHGWDVAQACGADRPIPDDLATELLSLVVLVVPDHNRGPLFAAPIDVAATADASDRLIAFLGRSPICPVLS
jgi:uncharacterized protein (TIGR03086 family)